MLKTNEKQKETFENYLVICVSSSICFNCQYHVCFMFIHKCHLQGGC